MTRPVARTLDRPGAVGADREATVLRFLAPPNEVDLDGRTIKSGHVLEWIDRAGFACAAAWSGSYCVTAYVGNVGFHQPISAGSLVETTARVIATGSSSMQVLVTVDAAPPTGGDPHRVAHCLLVLVAVDGDGRPRRVPRWRASNAVELDLLDLAEQRVAVRARIRAAMEAQEYTTAGTAPRLLLRFLATPRDVNWGGRVHGGTVMRWIDETAQACARSWTRRQTVGVYAGGIHFHAPIEIGSLVEVESRILHTGPHSVHLATHVRSADPVVGEYRTTTRCMSVFVPLDDAGRTAEVAPLQLVSDEDRRLDRHARALIAMRAELDSIE
ncbi:MAG: acyl-CoA thioesterase [Acidobacteria bacterium]|nr:acyl-CoA thioesterase [Acidobacteriota bacterium]